MDEKNACQLPDIAQRLEQYKNEKLKSDEKLSELQGWVDSKMSEMATLSKQMVVNYHDMMTKCEGYEKQWKRGEKEHARFQHMLQNLINKVEKLTGFTTKKTVCGNDTAGTTDVHVTSLEESVDTLVRELSAYKKRSEEVAVELAARAETEALLRRSLDELTATAELDRADRERDAATSRDTVQRLTAALDKALADVRDKQLATDELQVAFDNLVAADHQERMKVAERVDTLHAENVALAAELEKRDANERTLHEKVSALQWSSAAMCDTLRRAVATITELTAERDRLMGSTRGLRRCGDDDDDDDYDYGRSRSRSCVNDDKRRLRWRSCVGDDERRSRSCVDDDKQRSRSQSCIDNGDLQETTLDRVIDRYFIETVE